MKKLVLLSALSLMAVTAAAQPAMKIGVVNYLTVFKAVPQGQAAVKKLVSAMKPQIAQLKSKDVAIQKATEQLQKNAPTMSKSQHHQAIEKLMAQQQAFQKAVASMHAKQMMSEQKAQGRFQKDLHQAIQTVAKNGKYNLVLNSQGAPYFRSQYNISSQVISVMKKSA